MREKKERERERRTLYGVEVVEEPWKRKERKKREVRK